MKSIFIAVLVAASTLTFAQQINLQAIDPGDEKKIEILSKGGKALGSMTITKLDKSRSGLDFDFTRSGHKNFMIELIKNGTTLYRHSPDRGPNAASDGRTDAHVINSWISDEDPDWWWGVLVVAYCCIELSVSHSVGTDGETWSATMTFDCDCISFGGGLVTTENGDEFAGVTQIRLTPLQ